ncbi:MAG TPA: PilW family protein [Burkholderiaceae bacterium]|nr:PilW family protein [Burkholderiaceae bacterium]
MKTIRHRSQAGLSLIELLVSLAIGSFLIIGAITMQSQTRKTFDVNEAQARLQDSGRFVLSVFEPDLQLAGLYGYSQDPGAVTWNNAGSITTSNKLRPTATAVSGLGSGLTACGANFAVDVLGVVTVSNGTYPFTGGCSAQGGGAIAGTDVLTMRHSGTQSVTADASKLQLYSDRLAAQMNTQMFISNTAPEVPKAGEREVRDMVIMAYYVAKDADGHPGTPALRAKILTSVGGAPTFVDQEIIRGVEDLQVQFGVDPGDDLNNDGVPDDPGGDGMADFVNGYASMYVNADNAILSSAQVVAVRVWVRMRADQPEMGFVDGRRYQYADTDFTPNDNYRRVVMSRTIYLRNSRQQ